MKTILIVDDSPANIGLLFDCLAREGYRPLVAQDGKSAIETARRMSPDLILLDVIMPDMDGFDTCTALKDHPETTDIPIFFMTALTDIQSKVRGFECGAVDFISKPFQQEEVLARIATHLTLQEQKKTLIIANHIKEKIISVVAHDLRNPFTAIFAYLQMLTERYDQYDDEKRKAYIEKLREANQNLYSLLESLLGWITTGDGKLEYHPETVAVTDQIRLAAEASKTLADKKSIDLDIRVDETLTAVADRNMLTAVVRNLLNNAIKFTPRGGRVSVLAEETRTRVALVVKDTGIGMTPKQIEMVLSGKKLPSTKGTDAETGTGMGLVICLEFIAMMGGSLSIDSGPEPGCTFRVTLEKAAG